MNINSDIHTQYTRIDKAKRRGSSLSKTDPITRPKPYNKVEFTALDKADFQGEGVDHLPGYTGHESITEHGLVHMNGRVYSPRYGRFLSADPTVPYPDAWHSYNRYMYVGGSPANRIDPTGFTDENVPDLGVIVCTPSTCPGPDIDPDTNWLIEQSMRQYGSNLAYQNVEIPGGAIRSDVCAAGSCHGVDYSGSVYMTNAQLLPLEITAGIVTSFVPISMASRPGQLKSIYESLKVSNFGGTIRNVNKVGGKQNCANCSIATDATLAGNPASALSGGITNKVEVAAHFGSKFGGMTSLTRVEAQMVKAGNGSRGVIFAAREGRPGHFFNVVNQNGMVRFLDGQTGSAFSSQGQNFIGYQLLKTN
jgi:RHS repeat-associated protein